MESGIAEYRFIMEGLRMKEVVRQIIKGTLLMCILFVAAACSRDAGAPDVSSDNLILSISFRAATPPVGYENGSTYENYIGSYRIYFFDAENKFIAEFQPVGFWNVDDEHTEYRVLGKAPETLVEMNSFKVVVLANWPEYPNALIEGETTIAQICTASTATFGGPQNILSEKVLIPFYGVHEYSDVTFKPDERTELAGSIALLRAMAKVEVIMGTTSSPIPDDVEVTSLKLYRYNKSGYCAPKDVFSQNDYGQGAHWETDYLRNDQLHIVDGVLESEGRFDFQKETDDTGKEKWVLYVPEYQNINVGENYSRIEVKFNFQGESDVPYTIYFAKYDENGVTTNGNDVRMNIERNNLYRFTITMNGSFAVVAAAWTNVFENNFDF